MVKKIKIFIKKFSRKLKEIAYDLHFRIVHIFDRKEIDIDKNTFVYWEPWTGIHNEIIPGFVKYLLDLNYKVVVLNVPKMKTVNLFSRFKHKNLKIKNLLYSEILRMAKSGRFAKSAGIMIGSFGHIGKTKEEECKILQGTSPVPPKILYVVHSATTGNCDENTITLRELNANGLKSTVVNPHYFGDIAFTKKNTSRTLFAFIGAIVGSRRNIEILFDAVKKLDSQNINNFSIIQIGNGESAFIPKEFRKYFEMKGILSFDKMYNEIERSDFILALLDEKNPEHDRYITNATSGTFQLVYGFNKPIIVADKFAAINGFTNKNSILYKRSSELADAMKRAIEMSDNEYDVMRDNLFEYSDSLYKSSLTNMKDLIARL